MRKIFKIAANELRSLFYSPVAWFILIVFTIQAGINFSELLKSFIRRQAIGEFNEFGLSSALISGYSGLFSVIQHNLYLYIPVLTMGLMSKEFGSGSIKLLYSSPLTPRHIVLGKYLSMLIYGAVLTGILAIFIVFSIIVIPNFDIPMAISGLIGLYLLIAAYSAIGLYMSSLTSYAIVAAVGTLAVLSLLNFIGDMGQNIEFVRDIAYWLSIKGRASVFISGLLDSEGILYFIIVILFFVILSIIRIQSQIYRKGKGKRFMKYAILMVSVVISGYITSIPRFKYYYDMTATQVETLSEASRNIMKKIKGDLKITTYVNILGKNAVYGLPRNLKKDISNFNDYIRFKPDMQMDYVYYYKEVPSISYHRYANLLEKERAEKYAKIYKTPFKIFRPPEEIGNITELRTENYNLVRKIEYKGKSAFLRMFDDMMIYPSETEISAAIGKISGSKMPVAAFVTGEGERSPDNAGDRDYYSFAKNTDFRYALVNQGFDIVSHELSAANEIPAGIDILVIADPKTGFSDDNIEKIIRFIESGGNLFIAGEPGKQDLLNPILEILGLSFTEPLLFQENGDFDPGLVLCRPTKQGAAVSSGYNKLVRHKTVIVMPGAVGIEYKTDKGFTPIPLMEATDNAYYPDLKYSENMYFPFPDTVLAEQNITVMALKRNTEKGEQRIIVTGDADCISNAELSMVRKGINASNYSLVTESFKWLTKGEFPVDVRRPAPKDTDILLKHRAIKWIKTGSIIGFPLLLLISGILLLRMRRKN